MAHDSFPKFKPFLLNFNMDFKEALIITEAIETNLVEGKWCARVNKIAGQCFSQCTWFDFIVLIVARYNKVIKESKTNFLQSK